MSTFSGFGHGLAPGCRAPASGPIGAVGGAYCWSVVVRHARAGGGRRGVVGGARARSRRRGNARQAACRDAAGGLSGGDAGRLPRVCHRWDRGAPAGHRHVVEEFHSIADILAGAIGVEPGERTRTRVAQRNGHRPKQVPTPAGDVNVQIPKLREPRRRIDTALSAAIVTAYIVDTLAGRSRCAAHATVVPNPDCWRAPQTARARPVRTSRHTAPAADANRLSEHPSSDPPRKGHVPRRRARYASSRLSSGLGTSPCSRRVLRMSVNRQSALRPCPCSARRRAMVRW